jgi:hypothetical protein
MSLLLKVVAKVIDPVVASFDLGPCDGGDANSAILICNIHYCNANKKVCQGRLLVYDPVHPRADESTKVLWDSRKFGSYFYSNILEDAAHFNG